MDSFMHVVNDVSFTGVLCLVKAYRTARLKDVSKDIPSTSLSTGCESMVLLAEGNTKQ